MSILHFPRINFRGMFRTNPCTTNNDDVMPEVVERDTDTFGPDIGSQTDDQIQAYLRERVYMENNPGEKTFPFIRSGWNLYGDHTTTFEDTVITSVVTGPGASQRIVAAAQDPLIGQPVTLLGSVSPVDPTSRGAPMICDLDPTGLVTTQLWIGGLQIGSGGPSGNDPTQMVRFDHDTRSFQNWLAFLATLGDYGGEQNFVGIGCMMQFAIPASAIPASVPFPSPGLQSLLAKARSAAGLVLRFRIFEVEPELTDDTLYAAFQRGQGPDNPAFGYLIGTIGVWYPGEPQHEPAGRKIVASVSSSSGWQSRLPVKYQGQTWPDLPNPWPPAQNPWMGPPSLIGNAVAQVDTAPSVISLDLADTFPKSGFRHPNGPQQPDARGLDAPKQKVDLGPLELAVITTGAPWSIASIDYGLADYSSYEDFGGIVDLPYDPKMKDAIASGTLTVVGASGSINAGTLLLLEQAVRVVTDDRGCYWMPNKKVPVRIKVYERGGPPTQDTRVYLQEYFNIVKDRGQKVRPNQTVAQDQRGLLKFDPWVDYPAGGTDWHAFPVITQLSGATLLSYQLDPARFGGSDGITGVPVWSFANYSSIRIFADDTCAPPIPEGGTIPWEFVYEHVLRFYYFVYPAMSRFIPLNSPDAILRAAKLIVQRLNTPDQAGFYTTYNMPVTRTMPPQKVQLLLKYFAQEQARKGTP